MSKKWEPHKEEILRLYIVENMTLDQVMDHMSQFRSFNQKKSHYEYRLKLWGARKNIKKEVLEVISQQDRKRGSPQSVNRGFYVVNGNLLAESRVNRARQRSNLDISTARWSSRDTSPRLLSGLDVRRAIPLASEIAVNWPKSLPWFLFEQRSNIVAPQSSEFIQILARVVDRYGLISRMTIGESSDLARVIYAASHQTQSSVANLARMLPCIPNNSQLSTMSISQSNSNDVVTMILKAFLFQVSNKIYEFEEEPWGEGLLSLFQELDKMNPTLLGHLIDSHDPTSEAILENLHTAAIRYGATALVSRLLQAGMDSNALLENEWGCHHSVDRGKAHFSLFYFVLPMTALQFAASTCNIQLASTLINAGAKADFGNPTPLQILCLSSGNSHPDALPFADLLVSRGAQLNTPNSDCASPLEGAVLSKNISLVRYLIQCGAADLQHWSEDPSSNSKRLNYKLLESEEFEFLLVVQKDTEASTSALQTAIMTEETSIAQVLLSSIVDQEDGGIELLLEDAFITACVAGDQLLAQAILGRIESQLKDNEYLISSVFLAASWDKDCRIAHLLVEHPALHRELQNSCLSFFQAAALHGNSNLIMLLHSSGFDMTSGSSLWYGMAMKSSTGRLQPPPPPPMSWNPLGCAIAMGHRDVIETLLNLGADTTGIPLMTAMLSRSSGLITQVINQHDSINEPDDKQVSLNTALDFAIRERIDLTIIRHLMDAGATLQGDELINAVRSDDQEVVDFFLPKCYILAANSTGENILEVACCTGNLEMALFFFGCGGNYGSRALLLAVSRAVKTLDYSFVEHILTNRHPGPIDEYEASAIVLSVRMRDTTLIDMLLHESFQPSTALSIYCGYIRNSDDHRVPVEKNIRPLKHENTRLDIQKIVEHPCSKHPIRCYSQFSPLLVAAATLQEKVVSRMLAHGYLPEPRLVNMVYESEFKDKKIKSMITSAYVSQISDVVDQEWHERMLLIALEHAVDLGIIKEHFAKLPSLDFEFHDPDFSWGTSPLRNAMYSRSYDHVRAVLEAGATADVRKWAPAADAVGRATEMGSLEIVSLLLDHGADINHDPHRLFADVLRAQDLRMAAFLLDRGLDVNAPLSFSKQTGGDTCLEMAAKIGIIEAVEMLFSHGLDIQGRARIHFVRSVVFATRACHHTVVRFLKERGEWNDEDDELSKKPRATESNHQCAQFLYDDETLEGCDACGPYPYSQLIARFQNLDVSSVISRLTGGEEGATNPPRTFEAADEQFTSGEMESLTNDTPVLDRELEALNHEQTTELYEWTPYGRHDRELDAIVEELFQEDGITS